MLEKRRAMAEAGAFPFPQLPFGYAMAPEGGRRITVDAVQANIVRMMFNLYADGATPDTIASFLNDAGFTTRSGNAWLPRSVACILDNPVYEGRIVLGRTLTRRVRGRRVQLPGPEDGRTSVEAPSLRILDAREVERVARRRTAGISDGNGRNRGERR